MRKWIVLVMVIALALVVWRVLGSGRRSAAPAQQTEAAVPVEVAAVQTKTLVDVVSAGGSVEAAQEVTVAAKIPGRVAAVRVNEGDRVTAGQVLIRLEDRELLAQVQQAEGNLAAAQARLRLLELGARPQERVQVEQTVAQARANFETATESLTRMQTLYDSGAVSKSQLDAARLQYDVARAQYESAQQQLSVVQTGARPEELEMARAQVMQAQAAATFARLQAANATLTSPLSGTVTARSIEPGSLASPGVPLMTVAQIDTVSVVLDVSEIDLSRLKVGQIVTVRADAYPDTTFRGVVKEISQAASSSTRTFKVKVAVENPRHDLKPGMFARAEITIGVKENALVIPRDAIVTENGRSVVFVVSDGKARVRQIDLGMISGPVVEVRSGVEAGESVVVAGQTDLTDGDAVTVR